MPLLHLLHLAGIVQLHELDQVFLVKPRDRRIVERKVAVLPHPKAAEVDRLRRQEIGVALALFEREVRQITTSQRLVVNCYLVWDEVTREAALFDTGWEGAPIFEIVEQEKLDLRHLFITHTHEDHISALGEVRRKFPRIKLHSSSKNAPVDQRNRPNDFIHLGSLRITNRATPGHADDGVTYVIGNFPEDAPNVAIVGDCIFAGSIGTGFVSTDQLKESIRNQIFTLPDDTLICPGHGPLTTVGTEKRHNPFF